MIGFNHEFHLPRQADRRRGIRLVEFCGWVVVAAVTVWNILSLWAAAGGGPTTGSSWPWCSPFIIGVLTDGLVHDRRDTRSAGILPSPGPGDTGLARRRAAWQIPRNRRPRSTGESKQLATVY